MTLRYIIALILTVALLIIARRASTRHAEEFNMVADGITLSHKTVTEAFEESPRLELKSSETALERAIVFFSEQAGGPYQNLEMTPTDGGYYAKLPTLEKGKRYYYHIDVFKNNIKLATFPPTGDQFIKFKGHVSSYVLIPHIICMFATIFFGVLAAFTAIDASREKGSLKLSIWFALLAFVFGYIGGIPLGIEVVKQTFGGGWGGWPIGNDWTDTKTEIFLLFWLVTLILSFNGLRGRKMLISRKTYAIMTILSLVVTFITFLIPHSI